MRYRSIALLTLVCGACASTTAPTELERKVSTMRELTRSYQSHTTAKAAGYEVKITDCMSDVQGAMGYHFGKAAYIDGTPDELKPEVVMYAPKANGELELVGIEYVVPFDKWTAAAPPTLHGQTFQRNEMFQVWALHMWIWRDNPNGLFASWNPNVSCAHAGAAKL